MSVLLSDAATTGLEGGQIVTWSGDGCVFGSDAAWTHSRTHRLPIEKHLAAFCDPSEALRSLHHTALASAGKNPVASRLNSRSSRLISDRRGAGRARAEAGRCLALPLGQGRDPPRSAEFCGTGCDRVQDTRRSFTPQAHNVATVTSGMRQSLVIELWVRSMRVASSGEIEPSGAPAAPHALDFEIAP